MKNILCYIFPLLLTLVSCSGGGGGGGTSDGDGVKVLQAGVVEKGSIETVGDVDWYRFRVNEVRSIVQVRLAGQYLASRSDENFEFLVTVFEQDANGQKVRLMADHDNKDNPNAADMTVSVFVDQPKDIFISVRDLMDDTSSTETYALAVNYENNDDEDNTFENAVALTINGNSCPQDSISTISDVDCYTFTVNETGSYEIVADFNAFGDGSSVNLEMELYKEEIVGGYAQSELVEDLENNSSDIYSIVRPLTPGKYNLMIADQGRNDKDVSSWYSVCVNSVESDEILDNDVQADATSITSGTEYNGSLDYTGDEDWYQISVGSDNLLKLEFDASANSEKITYLAEIYDSNDSKILTHEIHSGPLSIYECQLYLESSTDHYVVIKAINNVVSFGNETAVAPVINKAPYTFTVTLDSLNDPAENSGGNNTSATATPIAGDGSTVTGLIGYRGDVDYYSVSVTGPKILEVFLNTTESSSVEYSFSIIDGDDVIIRRADTSSALNGTSIKTSVFVSGSKTVHIKVCDFQGDDGDDVVYDLVVGVNDIPASLPGSFPAAVSSPEYLVESPNGGVNDETVILNYNTLIQKTFRANTTLLDFDENDLVDQGDGTYTVELPWVGGYVDYDGDNDFYQMDLVALPYGVDNPAPQDFYYDISVRLVTAAGTDVEYLWKLYIKGETGNYSFIDRPGMSDRYLACAGDDSPNDISPLDLTVPTGDTPFWVANDIVAAQTVSQETFFSISDFEFLVDPQNNEAPLSFKDNDWGYDTPYYFKITLTYHPGVRRP